MVSARYDDGSRLAEAIVDRFGGPIPLAECLTVSADAIYKWLQRGQIPPRWHGLLLDIAGEQGVALTFDELRLAGQYNRRPISLVGSPK
jgi:hypothetical protein